MQLELRRELIDRLINMPETGMGYQIVDLLLADGRVVPNVTIFNCEVVNLPDAFVNISPSDISDVRLSVRQDRR